MRALSLMVLIVAASCTYDYGSLNGKAGAGDSGPDAPLPSPDTGVPPGSGGSTGVGGVTGSGGIVASGGSTGSGGIPVFDGGGGKDAPITTGGSAGSGGVLVTGGTPGTGGTIGTGGMGTLPGSGGVSESGGRAGTGGAIASGGTVATGGKIGSGGIIGSGGVTATGGTLGTGGIGTLPGSGGVAATGGISGSGGLIGFGGVLGAGGIGSGGVAATGGTLGTGGTGGCLGPLPVNYGQSCGFCGGTIACDASCTRSDTSCAPTGGNVQFRNELVISTDVPPSDHVLDAYSGAPYNVFINTNCCTGGMWTVTTIATGGYLITNHAYTDSSGSHLALEAAADGSGGYGLQLGSVPNNATAPTPAQAWTFTALAGGKFRLTNAALGSGWSFAAPPDIASWNFVLMAATADVPAQHWVVSANP